MIDFMEEALKEAYAGINAGHGGPFGSVIVKDGAIIGRGHNRVVADNDPTAHGEITAIREACARLGSFDLSGSAIYTTAEPCPMCLGAILWANIGEVYYGCNRADSESIGFRDRAFYDVMSGESKALQLTGCGREECLALFRAYAEKSGRIMY